MGEIITMMNYQTLREQLAEELTKQANSFVKTGYLLRVAMETDILKESGYANVNEFAKAEFGIDASTVSRYININMRFSKDRFSEQLEDQYSGHGYAKLSMMLLLPDVITEEIPESFSKTEIKAIKEEFEAEKKVSDLERLMEDREQEQIELANTLERVMYQLFLDQPEHFDKMWHIYDEEEWGNVLENICDVLAPEGESAISVRIKGVGRMMMFIHGTDKQISIVNMRTEEREEFSWEEGMENCLDKFFSFTTCGKETAEETWVGIYGTDYPMGNIAPVQEKTEEKPKKQEHSPVQRKVSKVTKAAPEKPREVKEVPAAAVVEQQLPGQMNVKDYPELMPEKEKEDNGTDVKHDQSDGIRMDDDPYGAPEGAGEVQSDDEEPGTAESNGCEADIERPEERAHWREARRLLSNASDITMTYFCKEEQMPDDKLYSLEAAIRLASVELSNILELRGL